MPQTSASGSPLDYYRLWIGVGFALLLIIFLIVAYFRNPRMTDGQRQILGLLSALCAGSFGFFLAGDALFKLDAHLGPNSTLVVSGTAGFALFFAVLYQFPKTFKAPNAFSFSVPEGWTFEQAARAIAQNDHAVVEFQGFTVAQLAEELIPTQLQVDNPEDALRALRHLAKPGTVPEYQVAVMRPRYIIRATV